MKVSYWGEERDGSCNPLYKLELKFKCLSNLPYNILLDLVQYLANHVVLIFWKGKSFQPFSFQYLFGCWSVGQAYMPTWTGALRQMLLPSRASHIVEHAPWPSLRITRNLPRKTVSTGREMFVSAISRCEVARRLLIASLARMTSTNTWCRVIHATLALFFSPTTRDTLLLSQPDSMSNQPSRAYLC